MSYIGNQPTSVAFLTDQFSGTGSQTAFTLSAAPANTASILVAVSGVLQDPTTYSTSGLTLTFSAAPPSGTGNISVRYLGIPASNITTTAYRTLTEFTATAGQTTFTVPSYTVGYISVYRNGAMLGTADFTATNGTTVVLATGATSGDLITTESFYVSSVLNAIPAVANAVTSTYLNTGAVTTTKIADANVTQAKLAAGVAGNGPSVSAYLNGSSQNFTMGVNTLATLDAEEWDTGSCFNNTGSTVTLNGLSTPAYAFCPNVAGYYQVNCQLRPSTSGTDTNTNMQIYKNGSNLYRLAESQLSSGISTGYSWSAGCAVYLNGTGDYIQLYGAMSGTGTPQFNNSGSPYTSRLQASLVRSA